MISSWSQSPQVLDAPVPHQNAHVRIQYYYPGAQAGQYRFHEVFGLVEVTSPVS
jgi:hypothetical protein